MTGQNVLVTNRKAFKDFSIDETLEAGIELRGTEIKSLRDHKGNLNDSFARVDQGEIFLYNFHISPYDFGNINNVDPVRPRKLLLHKKQIQTLYIKTQAKGYTLVPLKVYLKKGLAKVEIGIAQGKKLYDRREDIKKRETDIEIKRAMRGKRDA